MQSQCKKKKKKKRRRENYYSLSLVAVPEVFAKGNSTQFPMTELELDYFLAIRFKQQNATTCKY